MKRLFIVFLLSLFVLTPTISTKAETIRLVFDNDFCEILEDVDIEIDGGSVIVSEDRRGGDEIEITEDYELFINGDEIQTNREQQELLREYHEMVFAIYDSATDIGMEGVKIGLEGAKLGLKALAGVIRLLRSDYDKDDLERDMERESARLEAKADRLEEYSEEIEEMAEELKEIHYDLGDEIPELAHLDWWQ